VGGDDHLLDRLFEGLSLGKRLPFMKETFDRRASEPERIQQPLSVSPPVIQGVGTSVAAFLGPTTSGPRNTPIRVTSLVEYERTFGGLDADDTGVSVRLFFENGGLSAYVIRADSIDDGLQALRAIDRFNLLSIPGTSRLPRTTATRTVAAAAALCEERRAFYVADAPASLTAATVTGWKANLPTSPNAALYFPGLQVADPLAPGTLRDVPASGAVVGVIARTDIARGVWKAPAGNDGDLRAVGGLTRTLSDAEQDHLTQAGVNPIRAFPARGIRVWGSRTLASAEVTDWKYVSVRRLLLLIEDSIDEGTRWAMFEPNDEPLWRALRSSIENFLLGLYQGGALTGRTPEDAYLVRCDRMTMTQDDIDNGRLIVLVGIAPIRPAELITARHMTSVLPPP
jgi:phage tail sheath protein FI